MGLGSDRLEVKYEALQLPPVLCVTLKEVAELL